MFQYIYIGKHNKYKILVLSVTLTNIYKKKDPLLYLKLFKQRFIKNVWKKKRPLQKNTSMLLTYVQGKAWQLCTLNLSQWASDDIQNIRL